MRFLPAPPPAGAARGARWRGAFSLFAFCSALGLDAFSAFGFDAFSALGLLAFGLAAFVAAGDEARGVDGGEDVGLDLRLGGE